MSSKVYIAGLGIISAIGNDINECVASLECERAGMNEITYLKTIHQKELPVAEVKMNNDELAAKAGLSNKVSRTALLSMIAAKEALYDAAIANIDELRTGFISANTVGGIDKTGNFFQSFFRDKQLGDLHDVVNHECGRITEVVADKLGINHFTSTINTACSSSANSIMLAARLIKAGMLDIAIAGGVDALTKFTLNGFHSLLIVDKQFCKPFDEDRKGLNLGEGAGYVVLVSEKIAGTMRKDMYCELKGFANANDAYHPTASSPDGNGSYLAMQGALQNANLAADQIDYINLHGTGTQNNDESEGIAIERLFKPRYPKMSSTKSFTGHTLGASGGIEAVFSTLSVKNNYVYPNLRLQTPVRIFPFAAEKKFTKHLPIHNVLSNSFGFGGNCSSLIFSKI
ncbi:MAG: beta-ketoacyl-[acyl-carrier-protein] synthase family protein [Bacteroidota bacterium]|nr:beta-ketoacyl-[acyl-carrier-protein] synthase family protein [Bacteroidota bacterium]